MLNLIERADGRNGAPCLFRTRLVRAGWVVIRRNDGQRKSIPVLRRRTIPFVGLRGRQ